eukprot:552461-Prorocentrum_minimum.AAC.1
MHPYAQIAFRSPPQERLLRSFVCSRVWFAGSSGCWGKPKASPLKSVLLERSWSPDRCRRRASNTTTDCESGRTVRKGGYGMWLVITGHRRRRYSGIPGAFALVRGVPPRGSGTRDVCIRGGLASGQGEVGDEPTGEACWPNRNGRAANSPRVVRAQDRRAAAEPGPAGDARVRVTAPHLFVRLVAKHLGVDGAVRHVGQQQQEGEVRALDDVLRRHPHVRSFLVILGHFLSQKYGLRVRGLVAFTPDGIKPKNMVHRV